MFKKRISVKDCATLEKLISEVNWQPLNNFVKEVYGCDIEFNINVEGHKENACIRIRSEENPEALQKNIGIFTHIFDKVEMKDFGVGVSFTRVWENLTEDTLYKVSDEDRSNYYDENDIRIFFPMDIRYTHKDGSRNSMELFRAEWTRDEGWKFRKAGEQEGNTMKITQEMLDEVNAHLKSEGCVFKLEIIEDVGNPIVELVPLSFKYIRNRHCFYPTKEFLVWLEKFFKKKGIELSYINDGANMRSKTD